MIGAAAIDVASGRRVARDGDRVVPAASTVKVLVSLALWRAIDCGELDPRRRWPAADVPVAGGGGLLESMDPGTAFCAADLDLLMLAVSDNAATNVLLDALGLDAVNAEAARLGLARTAVRRRMMDDEAARAGRDNVTCAADMARLMAALADGRRIPSRRARRTLAALAESHHAPGIAAALPPPAAGGRVVYLKAGELDAVRHGVVLVDDGEARTAVAVLSSPPGAPEALARVAAAMYRSVRAAAPPP